MLRLWVLREINSRFCSKTQWQMFLLVSGRHVGAHLGGHQHGGSIQISINLGKTFLLTSSARKIAVTWILARVFAYLSSFYFQILDLIDWMVFIFYFDLFWMAWHWKPALNLSQPYVSLYCNEMFLEMNSQRYLTIIWARDFYLTNRFHVALRLLSNRPQMTSKCGKNKKRGTQGDCRVCHWWFLPHFDVFCDQK